jgi:hypothetical protein
VQHIRIIALTPPSPLLLLLLLLVVVVVIVIIVIVIVITTTTTSQNMALGQSWLPSSQSQVPANFFFGDRRRFRMTCDYTRISRVWSCGICGGQSGAGAGILRVLRFPLSIFIPPLAPQSLSSIIWGWYSRVVVAAVPSGLCLTPLRILKKIINTRVSVLS